MEGKEDRILKKAIMYVVGATVAYAIYSAGWENGYRKAMPQNTQVQSGYIAPSNLEIECKDLDGNGEPETIMKIKDREYLLKYDSNGIPILLAYDVKVVPNQD